MRFEPITRACKSCGGEFIQYRRARSGNDFSFCSTRCRARAHRIPFAKRIWDKVDKSSECWEWTGKRYKRGYGMTHESEPPHRSRYAHRIVWQVVNGPIPDGIWVLHRCDNPPCVRPDHLFLGTPADNTHDMIAKGRNSRRGTPGDANGSRAHPERLRRGEANPAAKLDAARVTEIRRRYIPELLSARQLAREYGVSQATILRVVQRLTWAHVP